MIYHLNNKFFFIHVPKTGGCFVNYYIQKYFCTQYKYRFLNSYVYHQRDWSNEELLSFIKLNKTFIHNHYIDESIFEEYKKNKWIFFSFFRNPKEILCSSYFYNKKIYGDNFTDDINDFMCLKSKENFFVSFWRNIDFLLEFNKNNFSYFLKKILKVNYNGDFSIVNASANKGYFYYLKNSIITKKTDETIEKSDFFRDYLDMKKNN
jgi:hypothetical protein